MRNFFCFCSKRTEKKANFAKTIAMNSIQFDRSKHVFRSDAFAELIKDTIRFFNGTPVHRLPPPEHFDGTGVYAIYYVGGNPYYADLYKANRLGFLQPIYVGKAVPRGWRQARTTALHGGSSELYRRLVEHNASISCASNLDVCDFHCRFMILEGSAADMIGTVEAALIRTYTPVWNSVIDGFGNHDPGKGRYNQARSDWDVLHPGRPWADRCKGEHSPIQELEKKLEGCFKEYSCNDK